MLVTLPLLSAKYRFQGLLIYDNLLTINCSTETLGLLPLASILLSGMHYFVWHSYHWHKHLILAFMK